MRLAACAVIFRANRVLLGRRAASRSYYPGAWDIFGGHVLADETPAMGVVRELEEELGIQAVVAGPALVMSEPNPDTHGPGEFHVFLVREWHGEPALSNDEHDALGWFTLAEAAALALTDPAIVQVLEQVAPWDAPCDRASNPTPLELLDPSCRV